MKMIKIEDYQLEELKSEKLYINKYDLSLMYLYELNRYWKEFLFDMLMEMTTISSVSLKDSSLELLKSEYKNIIENFGLKIDIKDYIEISDYISFNEWEKEENNGAGIFSDGIYLIVKD